MKTTMVKSLLLVSCLSLFAVGCGKDGGGGSSSNNYGNMNPITDGNNNPNINSQAVSSYNLILNWRNKIQNDSRQERGFIGQGFAFSKGKFTANQQNQLPEGCKEYIGGFLVLCKDTGTQQPNVTPTALVERKCISKTPNNNGSFTVKYKSISSSSTKTLYEDCMNVTGGTSYSVGNNTELNDILAFRKGKIYQINQVQGQAGVYVIFVGPRNDGYYGQATHAYQINTNIHSIYNPVANQAIGSQDYVQLYEAF